MSEFARNRADDGERRELCELLAKDFERTENAVGGSEVVLRFAAQRLRLRFAGEPLANAIIPSLRHLIDESGQPAGTTIHLWDRSDGPSSLVLDSLMRTLSWHWPDHLGPRGELNGWGEEPVRASFHPGPNALSVFDYPSNRAYYWVNNAAHLPWHECASPLRSLLSWWAAHLDMQLLHAAAVGNQRGAVLIVGKGGSGKSTSALAALCSGMSYLGDDYCIVSTQPEPQAHSVYCTAKLRSEDDLQHLPALAASVSTGRPDADKLVLQLAPNFEQQMPRTLPLRAICVPRLISGVETTAARIGAGPTLAALAPSTLLQLSGSGSEALRWMSAFVRSVPCFELQLAGERSGIPRVLADVIEQSAAPR